MFYRSFVALSSFLLGGSVVLAQPFPSMPSPQLRAPEMWPAIGYSTTEPSNSYQNRAAPPQSVGDGRAVSDKRERTIVQTGDLYYAPSSTRPMAVLSVTEPNASSVSGTPALIAGHNGCSSGCSTLLEACDSFRHPPFVWANAEYLLWWMKDAPINVPLATTDPRGNQFNPTSAGLADPSTRVLIGEKDVEFGATSGARWSVGFFLGDRFGIESTSFVMASQSQTDSVNSNMFGLPIIFRPILNTDPISPDPNNAGIFISAPGALVGGVSATSTSRMWGTEVNAVADVYRDCHWSFQALGGYRYLDLREGLDIADSSTVIGPTGFFTAAFFERISLVPGDVISVVDSFHTNLHFHGGQIGGRAQARMGMFSLGATTKLALGAAHKTLDINGITTLNAVPGTGFPPGLLVSPAGTLAVASNCGRFKQDDFAVLPEIELHLGCHLSDRLQVFMAYNFLYLSQVLRPGDQVNIFLNDALSPASPRFGQLQGLVQPVPPLKLSDFWAQGISFGLSFSY